MVYIRIIIKERVDIYLIHNTFILILGLNKWNKSAHAKNRERGFKRGNSIHLKVSKVYQHEEQEW